MGRQDCFLLKMVFVILHLYIAFWRECEKIKLVYVRERQPITLGNAQTSHSLNVADKDKNIFLGYYT